MKTAAGPEINFFTPTEVDMSEAARDRQRRRAGGTVPNENSLLLFHSARNVGVIVAVRQNPKELCIKYVCGGGRRTHEIRSGSRGSLGHCAAISNNARGPSELTGLRGITILWRFPA